jgi:hypothetical protein
MKEIAISHSFEQMIEITTDAVDCFAGVRGPAKKLSPGKGSFKCLNPIMVSADRLRQLN